MFAFGTVLPSVDGVRPNAGTPLMSMDPNLQSGEVVLVDLLLVSLQPILKLIGPQVSLQDSHQKVVQGMEHCIVPSMEAHSDVRIALKVSRVVCTMADVIMEKRLLTNVCLICHS